MPCYQRVAPTGLILIWMKLVKSRKVEQDTGFRNRKRINPLEGTVKDLEGFGNLPGLVGWGRMNRKNLEGA